VVAAGGMERLALNASLVGIHIQGAFDSKDPEFLAQILDEIDSKTAKLNAAMEEYGFTWEDMGERYRAAQLGDQFDALLEKTQLLRGAGIDYATILERQAEDYSELVQAAIRTGTEIPIALQPVLQQLLEAGQLIGENGEKLTDLEDISWAKSLTQGFDQVTGAIYDLRDAILGVNGAIDQVSGRRISVGIDTSDLSARGDGSGFDSAHWGGFLWNGRVHRFHAGGPIGGDEFPILAQSGEFVMRRAAVNRYGVDFMRAVNSGRFGGGSQPIHIHNYVGGEKVDELVVDAMDRRYRRRFKVGAN
jgi:hypothetical protein